MSTERLEVKFKNLTYIMITGFVVIGLLIIGLYFRDGSTRAQSNNASNNSSNSSSTTYDVSKMKKVTGEEANKLFEGKGTKFLYIGRPGCGICVNLVPNLNQVISDIDVEINYLELTDSFRTDFGDLFNKLTIQTTINDEKGTYGELLKSHGYTPIVVVIKDGKMVEGFVGNKSASAIESIFSKYLK